MAKVSCVDECADSHLHVHVHSLMLDLSVMSVAQPPLLSRRPEGL